MYLDLDLLLEKTEYVHRISNHPVHILNDSKGLSSSSFIPFCQFGKEMKLMGVKNEHFNVPICNSFKTYVLDDQLCYQVDLNQFKSKFSAINMKLGLMMLVDNNENRQFTWNNEKRKHENEIQDWQLKEEIDKKTFTVHIGTLG